MNIEKGRGEKLMCPGDDQSYPHRAAALGIDSVWMSCFVTPANVTESIFAPSRNSDSICTRSLFSAFHTSNSKPRRAGARTFCLVLEVAISWAITRPQEDPLKVEKVKDESWFQKLGGNPRLRKPETSSSITWILESSNS